MEEDAGPDSEPEFSIARREVEDVEDVGVWMWVLEKSISKLWFPLVWVEATRGATLAESSCEVSKRSSSEGVGVDVGGAAGEVVLKASKSLEAEELRGT